MRRALQAVRSFLPGIAGLAFVVLVVFGVLEVPACRAVFAPPTDTETPAPADAQVAETLTPEDTQSAESQSAESDSPEAGPSAAEASESQESGPSRRERRRRPRPEPPDWNPREMLLPGLLMNLANGLFSLASIGAFVFVFAGVVAKKGSRWRGPTAQGLRWALIGSTVAAIGYSIRRAEETARFSVYMRRYDLYPTDMDMPERSFSEAFWGFFTFNLWPLLAAVGCGFVFAAIGLWAYRRRQQRPPQSEHGLDASAESHHA